MSSRCIDAVLFDIGGTLLRVEPSVGAVYSRVAREHGFVVEPERIQAGFRGAWTRSLERARRRGYRVSDDILRAEWLEIVADTFGDVVPQDRIAALFRDLYERFISAEVWSLVPGVRESLSYLRGEGLRIGVLSNWDSRLSPLLQELGLEQVFDFVVVSHAVGYEKPHPEIFARALALAGTAPGRTLHVGDSFFADIQPAQSLGLKTLWIASDVERGREAYPGHALPKFPPQPFPFWEQVLAPGARIAPTWR